jgi:uncharacterized membrane protein YfcA
VALEKIKIMALEKRLVIMIFGIGGLLGANMAEALPNMVLRKAFGIFLLVSSLYTIFAKK